MGKTIGIDLGTTNSAVSVFGKDGPEIIINANGHRTTPSIVAHADVKEKKKVIGQQWITGTGAKNQAVSNPLKTFFGVKRLIGRRFDDPEVKKMMENAPYKIVKAENGDAWLELGDKKIAPAEISAKILSDLKKAAEDHLGEEVTDAVVTVPAYFNDAQRQATKDAGKIAGLNVKRIINEPTAAALAYGMEKQKDAHVIVFDLGGGTFDVSVLDMQMEDGDGGMVKVLSTNGDTFLGGENFDERLIDHLIEEVKSELEVDLREGDHTASLQRLKEAAENAKKQLSTQTATDISIPFIAFEDGAPLNFEYQLTRQKLESLVDDLVKATIEPCKKALKDAGLTADDIDQVILVGGQTRMPKVIETVTGFFGELNKANEKKIRNDVNPDEIVSMGASAQGAILDGTLEDILLLDVIPLSIGIKTTVDGDNDVFSPVVERNSNIPAQFKSIYGTSQDNQRNLYIEVYQGERAKATDNKKLGEFTMKLPPGTPKGSDVTVSFNIDADGVLEVKAQLGKKEQKITVQANGGLSEEEVNAMLKEAEANKEADLALQAQRLAPVLAEQMLKEAEEDKDEEWVTTAPEDLKAAFAETVKELTEAVTNDDRALMVEKTAKLETVRTEMGKAFNAAATEEVETEDGANDNEVSADAEENNAAEPSTEKKKQNNGPNM